MPSDRSPKRDFRVLVRRRDAYDGATMVDVQLQVADTGAMVWAQTFSDQTQAEEFQAALESDLQELDDATFRSKYGVPSGS